MSQAFRIGTNIGALRAYNALLKLNASSQTAQLRLSSQNRINHVSDDTSGFNVGKSLDSKVTVMQSEQRNVGSAKDYLSTAETALLQVNDLLTQISAKYADANNPVSDKDSIADDIRSIASEIDSIMKTTKFNNSNLLAQADGSALTSSGVFDVGSNFSLDFASSSYLDADTLKTKINGGSVTVSNTAVTTYRGTDFVGGDLYSGGDQTSTIKAIFSDGSTESVDVALSGATNLYDVISQTYTQLRADFDSGGSFRIGYSGSMGSTFSAGVYLQNGKEIVSLETTAGYDIATDIGITRNATTTSTSGGLLNDDTDAVLSAASDITAVTDNVRSALGRVGNLTQALDYKSDFLTSAILNSKSAYSRLFDADMAKEQLNATKAQIGSQAATSMFSQLNASPQQVLQLFS